VLETELEHRVSNFKVIRAITYSATNPNEYQEIEVLEELDRGVKK